MSMRTLSHGIPAAFMMSILGVGTAVSDSNVPGGQAAAAPSAAAYPADINPITGSRLPPVQREDLDSFGRQLYDEYINEGLDFHDNVGPRGIRIHSPRVAEYMTRGNRYLRYRSGIEPRLRELIILVAAREMDSDYEWAAHEDIARDEGLEDEIIDIIRFARPLPADLGAREKALISLGREVLQEHEVSPETYARAQRLFGNRQLLDMVSLLAHYAATAIVLTTFDQQLPPGRTSTLPDR